LEETVRRVHGWLSEGEGREDGCKTLGEMLGLAKGPCVENIRIGISGSVVFWGGSTICLATRAQAAPLSRPENVFTEGEDEDEDENDEIMSDA